MEQTGYAWWVARMRRELSHVDVVRLDHFRGFIQAWHIPATAKTKTATTSTGTPSRCIRKVNSRRWTVSGASSRPAVATTTIVRRLTYT